MKFQASYSCLLSTEHCEQQLEFIESDIGWNFTSMLVPVKSKYKHMQNKANRLVGNTGRVDTAKRLVDNTTRSMLIGTNKTSWNPGVIFSNNSSVESKTCFKCLGIKLSANFTWTDHNEYISPIINKNRSLLHKMKQVLPLHVRILFDKSFIFSNIGLR